KTENIDKVAFHKELLELFEKAYSEDKVERHRSMPFIMSAFSQYPRECGEVLADLIQKKSDKPLSPLIACMLKNCYSTYGRKNIDTLIHTKIHKKIKHTMIGHWSRLKTKFNIYELNTIHSLTRPLTGDEIDL